MSADAGSPSPQETETEAKKRVRLGIMLGVAMAVMAASSFSVARGGILRGVRPEDITLLRFGVAGLIFLPFLLKKGIADLGGIGWPRALVLVVTAGPVAAFSQAAGYMFAPLAHGAVLVPMSVTVFCSVLAVVLLKERHGIVHAIGTAGILAGLAMISGEGFLVHGAANVWIGDLIFLFAGLLWAAYTILFRYWRLDSMMAMASVCVLSMVIMLVVYPLAFSLPHLMALPLKELLLQGVVQGLLSGTLTIAYNKIVVLLGAGRAVLFPAMVPGLAIVFGIPILGEYPTTIQLCGLASAMIGLLFALGVIRLPGMRRH